VSEKYCEEYAESIARQRLSKHVRTHASSNKLEVFSMCSALRNSMSAVFSALSVPRLYSEGHGWELISCRWDAVSRRD
jgi:hypothetical protein